MKDYLSNINNDMLEITNENIWLNTRDAIRGQLSQRLNSAIRESFIDTGILLSHRESWTNSIQAHVKKILGTSI